MNILATATVCHRLHRLQDSSCSAQRYALECFQAPNRLTFHRRQGGVSSHVLHAGTACKW